MEISRWSNGAMTVIELTGRLIIGPGESELAPLRDTIRDLLEAGCIVVGVDLSGLSQVDARGLGELATAMKLMRAVGGRLCLIATSPRVAKMLAVTRLDTVFEWCKESEPVVSV